MVYSREKLRQLDLVVIATQTPYTLDEILEAYEVLKSVNHVRESVRLAQATAVPLVMAVAAVREVHGNPN
jgi:hypothetical protein